MFDIYGEDSFILLENIWKHCYAEIYSYKELLRAVESLEETNDPDKKIDFDRAYWAKKAFDASIERDKLKDLIASKISNIKDIDTIAKKWKWHCFRKGER